MKISNFFGRVRFIMIGSMICLVSVQTHAADRALTIEESIGKDLFEGRIRFVNDGPSCISCHSIDNKNAALGGLFAKNLTDVYSRLGEGISSWLSAPPFPAMAASYQNNPLAENERVNLQAFLKYANEVKDVKNIKYANKGYNFMLIGGGIGLVVILIMINFIWFVRKRKMVKQDIFARQNKASDAKF